MTSGASDPQVEHGFCTGADSAEFMGPPWLRVMGPFGVPVGLEPHVFVRSSCRDSPHLGCRNGTQRGQHDRGQGSAAGIEAGEEIWIGRQACRAPLGRCIASQPSDERIGRRSFRGTHALASERTAGLTAEHGPDRSLAGELAQPRSDRGVALARRVLVPQGRLGRRVAQA